MLLTSRTIIRGLSLCAALLLAGVLCTVPKPLLAQPADATGPDASKRNQARSLADSGFQMFEQGRYDEALAHFQAAERIYHAPTLVLMVARTQEKRGVLAEAAAAYEQLVGEQLAADAPPEFTQAQQQAQQELAALRPRVPSVQFRLRERRDVYRVKLRIDGQAIAPSRLGGPISVNPGQHTIEVAPEGGTPTARTITFAEGQREMIDVELPAAPAEEPPEEAGPAEGVEEPDSIAPAVAVLGVAGAGLLVGIIAGVVALDKEAELEEKCPEKSCYPEDEETVNQLADDATASATVSTVGFVIAGLGAAAGLTLLLLRDTGDTPAESARLELKVHPTGALLQGSF